LNDVHSRYFEHADLEHNISSPYYNPFKDNYLELMLSSMNSAPSYEDMVTSRKAPQATSRHHFTGTDRQGQGPTWQERIIKLYKKLHNVPPQVVASPRSSATTPARTPEGIGTAYCRSSQCRTPIRSPHGLTATAQRLPIPAATGLQAEAERSMPGHIRTALPNPTQSTERTMKVPTPKLRQTTEKKS